ncbi:hypothetical protein MYG64_07285 [Ensifer adhaerens]|uniref:hypothetical protein n=1 Tax=Ensifer adhaerens TaxID=106592 RepID=UPI0021017582|nr:hypothetical protein [Ensifer adhaerens]UTV38088.1 hypothetical protein MYG64_07285 [Ensifer adhaerens]
MLIAMGAASMGPAALYSVINALVTGEISSRGVVTLSASEDPVAFYSLVLTCGVGATLGTAVAVFLLIVALKGRASRTGSSGPKQQD